MSKATNISCQQDIYRRSKNRILLNLLLEFLAMLVLCLIGDVLALMYYPFYVQYVPIVHKFVGFH